MLRVLCALALALPSVSMATTRNYDIVDHPRYKHLKKKAEASRPASIHTRPVAKPAAPKPKPATAFRKVNLLTLDTRDQAVCARYAETLLSTGALSQSTATSLCMIDPQNPYVSIAVDPPAPNSKGWKYSDLSPREQELARQTRNFFVPAAGMMAILFALPKSVTGWDSFDGSSLGRKWKDNVSSGPVMDHDKWAINYIGHPYAGAAYYVVARHAGFTQMESFAYSAFMSTFFWEYGIEAVAEVPSIQDLIVTPVLGALLGELFIEGSKRVRANNGQLLGSNFLGSTALFLMDPAGGILEATDNMLGRTPFSDAEFQVYASPGDSYESPRVGFNMIFWLRKR